LEIKETLQFIYKNSFDKTVSAIQKQKQFQQIHKQFKNRLPLSFIADVKEYAINPFQSYEYLMMKDQPFAIGIKSALCRLQLQKNRQQTFFFLCILLFFIISRKIDV
jgi:hypothetical protein